MRKLCLIILLVSLSSLTGWTQYYVDYGFSVGASNYLGEIGGGDEARRGGFVDMKLNASRWTAGGFFRYRISPKLGVKASLNYIRLTGDDANTTNPARRGRNLNFKNDMFEFLVNGELYIYKVNDVGGTGRYSTDFNLYFFGGAGLFYSNPKGQTASGSWESLRSLQTEGIAYSSFNFAIPLGIGFYYTIDRKYRLGMEVGWRTTFTDYIDDISSDYIVHSSELADKSSPALSAQIRAENPDTEQLPYPSTYQPGRKRGDPEHDDAYATITVNFSWAIRGRSKFYRSKNSWVLGKKKRRRRRKSRAKF